MLRIVAKKKGAKYSHSIGLLGVPAIVFQPMKNEKVNLEHCSLSDVKASLFQLLKVCGGRKHV